MMSSRYAPCSSVDRWRVSARYLSVQSMRAGKSAKTFLLKQRLAHRLREDRQVAVVAKVGESDRAHLREECGIGVVGEAPAIAASHSSKQGRGFVGRHEPRVGLRIRHIAGHGAQGIASGLLDLAGFLLNPAPRLPFGGRV